MPDSPTRPADQPTSPTKDKAGVKHGRRADDGSGAPPKPITGWGDDNTVKKPVYSQQDSTEFPTMAGESMDGEQGSRGADQLGTRPEDEEELQREVAAAPVEYHAVMPKLNELDAAGAPGTAKLAAQMANSQRDHEVDLSCLTAVLCGQLDDEDEPWVPDVILVQLTSELIEAQTTGQDEEDDAGPTDGPVVVSASNRGSSLASPTHATAGADLAPSSSLTVGGAKSDGDMGVSAAGRRRGRV
jgi:hypothetical protein